jgi:hypothetical protein
MVADTANGKRCGANDSGNVADGRRGARALGPVEIPRFDFTAGCRISAGRRPFPAGTGTSINVNADKIIDTLKFTFMGTFEAQKGRLGRIHRRHLPGRCGSKSQTRDLTVGNVTLPGRRHGRRATRHQAWVWTLAGTYRVVSDRRLHHGRARGLRGCSMSRKNWAGNSSANLGGIAPPPRTGNSELKDNVWDGIIGVKDGSAFGADREVVRALLRGRGYR